MFVDVDKAAYKGLGFARISMLGLIPAVLSSAARAAQAKAKELGLGGNMRGDGYQNGGVLIVGAGGDPTLLQWKQEAAPDHVANEEVLKALDIQLDPVPHATAP